ncbi:hypothetical protein F5B20DRAFT_593892 [Whalleya microplaca]|nr:hypothetical protein F5B20DRAFT_593892 [Whalleya microplaca]
MYNSVSSAIDRAADCPGASQSQENQHVPLVKFGENVMEFPTFPESDFCFQDENRAESLRGLLSSASESFIKNDLEGYEDVIVLADNPNEKVVDFTFQSMSIRVAQFRDVRVGDPKSYYQARRAMQIENKSAARMASIEPPMGRAVENMMMTQAIKEANVPTMHSEGGDAKKVWYQKLRRQVTRNFWIDHDRSSRDQIRQAAIAPEVGLRENIEEIIREDGSPSQDFFFQHYKDAASVVGNDIYERVDKDVFLVIDAHGETILCSVRQLFQRLFGKATTDKVTDAVKKWAALPPLPQPDTARHAVDEIIRQDKHPELDIEKATTPAELEQRSMCVVHYGTWAQQGHGDPDDVYLTDDTNLEGNGSWRRFRNRPNYARTVLPRFKRGVLGLSSEVVRFLLRTVAPKEYEECLEVFRGLPKENRIAVSPPNWATMFVLGINSFTERHKDKTDVKKGFAGLVLLGQYEGGDLCFPQMGLKLDYQPGGCVIFRGAELEHFVQDWNGYRIFLLVTNHQPVRNWAYRRLGKRRPRPNDPWFREDESQEAVTYPVLDENDDDEYDPCFEEEFDQEDPAEGPWTDADIHGAGTWDSGSNIVSSSSSGSTSEGGKRSLGSVYSDMAEKAKIN